MSVSETVETKKSVYGPYKSEVPEWFDMYRVWEWRKTSKKGKVTPYIRSLSVLINKRSD